MAGLPSLRPKLSLVRQAIHTLLLVLFSLIMGWVAHQNSSEKAIQEWQRASAPTERQWQAWITAVGGAALSSTEQSRLWRILPVQAVEEPAVFYHAKGGLLLTWVRNEETQEWTPLLWSIHTSGTRNLSHQDWVPLPAGWLGLAQVPDLVAKGPKVAPFRPLNQKRRDPRELRF